jgi:hypothetical protein
VHAACKCIIVCGWNTDPPCSLQIILTLLLMVGAVLARDGGHAYSGSNFVLYLSTRSCANQGQCSYTLNCVWGAADSLSRDMVYERGSGQHGIFSRGAAFVKEENTTIIAQNTAGVSYGVISSDSYVKHGHSSWGTSCTPHIPSSRTDQTVATSLTFLLL